MNVELHEMDLMAVIKILSWNEHGLKPTRFKIKDNIWEASNVCARIVNNNIISSFNIEYSVKVSCWTRWFLTAKGYSLLRNLS